jgi:hypothetical protein
MHAGLLERKTAKEEAVNQLGLRAPAPILCTYMAPRASAFVRKKVLARHINIARFLREKGEIAQGDLVTCAAPISGLTRSPRQDQDVRAGTSFAGTGTDQVRRSKERSRGCRHI